MTRGLDGLLVEAAAAGLTQRPNGLALTPRESVILGMVADGMTNRDIAQELELSRHTVKDHLSSIYRRLDATNRTAAVSAAVSSG